MDDCQGCPGCRSDHALARANKWEKGQDGLMSTAKELIDEMLHSIRRLDELR